MTGYSRNGHGPMPVVLDITLQRQCLSKGGPWCGQTRIAGLHPFEAVPR